MSFTVKVETKTVGNAMARLREQMNRTPAMLQAAGKELLQGVEDAFEKEGPGWTPLAASTVRERRRKGFGPARPIQHRTGTYKRSWKGLISDEELTITSGDFRARILQRSGKNRPARPVRISRADIVRAIAAARKALHG